MSLLLTLCGAVKHVAAARRVFLEELLKRGERVEQEGQNVSSRRDRMRRAGGTERVEPEGQNVSSRRVPSPGSCLSAGFNHSEMPTSVCQGIARGALYWKNKPKRSWTPFQRLLVNEDTLILPLVMACSAKALRKGWGTTPFFT